MMEEHAWDEGSVCEQAAARLAKLRGGTKVDAQMRYAVARFELDLCEYEATLDKDISLDYLHEAVEALRDANSAMAEFNLVGPRSNE